MKRRDLLKWGAAAAAVPAASAQQHAAHPKPVAIAPAGKPWTPALFDAHQNETVVVLTELIIPATDTPGAKAALVNRHLDKLLHDGPVADQAQFLEGLGWLDGYAIRKYTHPFIACTEAQQIAILTEFDTGKAAALAPGRAFFRLVKSLTARTYYATEIGVKELNKGGRVPASFACTGSDHA